MGESETVTFEEAVARLIVAVYRAEHESLRIPPAMAALTGTSTPYVQQLLSDLCEPPVETYLEVGINQGKTFCAAVGGKPIRGIAIDEWQTGRPGDGSLADKEVFLSRIADFRDRVTLVHDNCWNVRLPPDTKAQVYFYDAWHEPIRDTYGPTPYVGEHGQEKAWTHFWPALDRVCTVVVDDFFALETGSTWATGIRAAHYRGLKAVAPARQYEVLLPPGPLWWKGLWAGVVEKADA